MDEWQEADITKRLVQAGRRLGVPVLGHVVVGRMGHVSLAERGLLGAGG